MHPTGPDFVTTNFWRSSFSSGTFAFRPPDRKNGRRQFSAAESGVNCGKQEYPRAHTLTRVYVGHDFTINVNFLAYERITHTHTHTNAYTQELTLKQVEKFLEIKIREKKKGKHGDRLKKIGHGVSVIGHVSK